MSIDPRRPPRPTAVAAIPVAVPATVAARVVGASLLLALLAAVAGPAAAVTIYSNNFQSAAGPSWSTQSIAATPLPVDGSRKFLGRFDNQTVTLRLRGIHAHTSITLDFDFYAIGTWDGTNSSPYGPDIFTVGLVGGPSLFQTTFSGLTSPPFGIPFAQNYPDAYNVATHPAFTGAVEQRTLGYIFSGYDVSAVYHFHFVVPHTADSVVVAFTGNMAWEYGGAHSIDEEAWGLDNVQVATDATVDVAGGGPAELVLAGAVPNPATSRDLRVAFVLPAAATAPAQLELFDVAGRRVAAREVAALGAGAHVLDLAPARGRLAPGCYLVRLTQGGAARVARVVVTE